MEANLLILLLAAVSYAPCAVLTGYVYVITRHRPWFTWTFAAIFAAVAYGFGALAFYLQDVSFVSAAFIMGGAATIVESITLGKVMGQVYSPMPVTSETLLGNGLAALGEFTQLTNEYLSRAIQESGEKVIKEPLREFLSSSDFFSGCRLLDGAIDIRGAVEKVQREGEKGFSRVFYSFYSINSRLVSLHAAATSREHAREVFGDVLEKNVEKFGGLLYPYALPMLFAHRLFDPLLADVGEEKLRRVREVVAPLGTGIEVSEEGLLDMSGLYRDISRLDREEMVREIMARFSRLSAACYPEIRGRLGERADRRFLDGFSHLIRRYPQLVKFGILSVLPEDLQLGDVFRMEEGKSYLVEEERPEASFRMLKQLSGFDIPSMCISTTIPEDLRMKYGIKSEFIWISRVEHEKAVPPDALDILRDRIVDFMRGGRGRIVVLDCLEYLRTVNGFDQVLRFLYDMMENASISGAIFIVQISPKVFEERELALIRKNMSVRRR
jgi:hypothetical protein